MCIYIFKYIGFGFSSMSYKDGGSFKGNRGKSVKGRGSPLYERPDIGTLSKQTRTWSI